MVFAMKLLSEFKISMNFSCEIYNN